MTTPVLDSIPTWESYLDLKKDVLPWLQISEPQAATVEEKLRMMTDGVCVKVQGYLGRPLASTEFFHRFSGSGSNAVIMLPYYPIIEVVKVVEYRGQSGAFVLTEQTPEANIGNQEVFQVEPLSGAVIRTFQGNIQRPWFPGSKNIEITWRAGYNPVPQDIRMATLEYIKKWWDASQQRSTGTPTAYGYSGSITPTTAGLWGELQRELDLYSQQGLG